MLMDLAVINGEGLSSFITAIEEIAEGTVLKYGCSRRLCAFIRGI
jgi:hypothetical protein